MAIPTILPPLRSTTDEDSVWEEQPADIQTFFKEFLKEPFFPKQQEFVEAMMGTNPQEWATRYTEGIALWGKGAGKDRTAAKILVYVCYKLLCMRNPVQHFNQRVPVEYQSSLEDKLEVANVCINAQLAKTVFFKYFKLMIKNTRNPRTGKNWFIEKGLDWHRDVLSREVRFPKNITAHSLDSEEYTGEGLNLFFVIFDEIAGFDPSKARDLYVALRSTCVSRFPDHMKLLLLSYKRRDEDYMMTRFQQAEMEPRTYRTRAATWEVNLRRRREDFLEEYSKDPEGSQRMYECIGNTSEGGYIKFKSRISEVINGSGKENPIVGDLTSVINLRGIQFKPWFKPEPQTTYFIHVDLAKNQNGKGDACGLAMGHFRRGMKVTMSQKFIDGVMQYEHFDLSAAEGRTEVGAVLDLALQIRAVPGGEILFDEVREFIKRLKRDESLKFPIYLVTFDGWQSTDSIQLLRKDGVNADEQSVDKDNAAYDTTKSLIYRGILESYTHPTLIRELEQLRVTKTGKVDHPEGEVTWSIAEGGNVKPSKDVADAVAGCLKSCIDKGKSGFEFWSGALPGHALTKEEKARLAPGRYESEGLVRYGEKAPDWYKKHPN
jgi:hypothetical protein